MSQPVSASVRRTMAMAQAFASWVSARRQISRRNRLLESKPRSDLSLTFSARTAPLNF